MCGNVAIVAKPDTNLAPNRIKAARLLGGGARPGEVAAACKVSTETLRRWRLAPDFRLMVESETAGLGELVKIKAGVVLSDAIDRLRKLVAGGDLATARVVFSVSPAFLRELRRGGATAGAGLTEADYEGARLYIANGGRTGFGLNADRQKRAAAGERPSREFTEHWLQHNKRVKRSGRYEGMYTNWPPYGVEEAAAWVARAARRRY